MLVPGWHLTPGAASTRSSDHYVTTNSAGHPYSGPPHRLADPTTSSTYQQQQQLSAQSATTEPSPGDQRRGNKATKAEISAAFRARGMHKPDGMSWNDVAHVGGDTALPKERQPHRPTTATPTWTGGPQHRTWTPHPAGSISQTWPKPTDPFGTQRWEGGGPPSRPSRQTNTSPQAWPAAGGGSPQDTSFPLDGRGRRNSFFGLGPHNYHSPGKHTYTCAAWPSALGCGRCCSRRHRTALRLC